MMNSLYIHIPFCEKKCFYCSFVVAIAQQHRAEAYLATLDAEAKPWDKTEVQTVYIGGGTPTLLTVDQLGRLFKIIRTHFVCAPDAEITVEANPEGLEIDKAKALFDLGANRISLGIQTFNDHYLKFLGRAHVSTRALKAYACLREVGFKNISIDLMYGFPKQTMEDIDEDLYALQDLNPEHVSLYTLTIEENSRFFVQKIDIPHDQMAEQYEFVTRRLEEFGYEQYEISNYAKPGYASRHNKNYWTGGNYIGLGVGAHSHQNGRRWWNLTRLQDYIGQLGKNIMEGEEVLTEQQRLTETVLFGLRMNEGVDVQELQERFGCSLTEQQEEKIQEFSKAGFLRVNSEGYLCMTRSGRLVLDELASYLI